MANAVDCLSMRMIYLLRHGEIEDAVGRRYIGQTDSALSDKGRDRAEFWKKWLQDKGIASIVCSDLVRSSATAAIIANGLNKGVRVEPALREINLGDWDGRSMAAVRAESPRAYEQRGAHFDTFRPPGGESFEDLYRRAVPVFAQIAENAEASVVIVGHAGVNRVILCRVLGMPIRHLFRIRQDYGALNLIDKRRKDFQVVAVNLCPETFEVPATKTL